MASADTMDRKAAVKRALDGVTERRGKKPPSVAAARAGSKPGRPMTLPRGTGGYGPIGKNTGRPKVPPRAAPR